MKIGLFFAVFTSVDAFISLEICSLQRTSVKAKNRYHNDKPGSLSALGFWIRADVPLISMEVSIHGRGRLLELRLGIDAGNEVHQRCGRSLTPGDGALLDSGVETAIGPYPAPAPAVRPGVDTFEVRVESSDCCSGRFGLLTVDVACL